MYVNFFHTDRYSFYLYDMKKIGITGGIGSGKSTVCKVFSLLGVPVYISDLRAQAVMTGDREVIARLTDRFGSDIYTAGGAINKEKLSSLVFDSPANREIVNGIVHPAVCRDFEKWCDGFDESQAYVLEESAILFETGLWKMFDSIITVTCPLNERIKRVCLRDNCDEATARKKIGSQMPQEEKVRLSSFVIESARDSLMINKVLDIHKNILKNEI